ncbi:hypothetical protein QYF36_026577 [Acer negundo]|nr:hypothetical protein QYF36_026577 [Acer negundo]
MRRNEAARTGTVTVTYVWEYIQLNSLQNPANRKESFCDDKGIANKDTRQSLKQFCASEKPDIICLAEPWIDFHNIRQDAKLSTPTGPKPFRFNQMWADHEDFSDLVVQAWSSPSFSTSAMGCMVAKLKRLKLALHDWNKSVFGDVNQKLAYAMTDLANIQLDISTNGVSDEALNMEIQAKNVVDTLLSYQDSLNREKCLVK